MNRDQLAGDLLGSPRALRRLLEVNRDQTMLFVVHVDYDVLSEAIHDRTIFYVVHADCDVLSKVLIYQTLFHVVHVDYYMSSPR